MPNKKKGLRLSDDALQQWEHIQSDHHKNNWGVFELKQGKNAKVVRCLETGVGGAPQAFPYLDDTKLQWLGFRVTGVDEVKKANGKLSKSLRPKFVVICWLGEKMPPIQRAKFREKGSVIMRMFRNTVVQYYALDRDSVKLDYIKGKLDKLAKCTYFDWENKEQMLAVGLPPDIPQPIDPMIALKEAAAKRLAKRNAKVAALKAEREKKQKEAEQLAAEKEAAEKAAAAERAVKEEARKKAEQAKAEQEAAAAAAEEKKKYDEQLAAEKARAKAAAEEAAAKAAAEKAEEDAREHAEAERLAKQKEREAKEAEERARRQAEAEKAAAEAAAAEKERKRAEAAKAAAEAEAKRQEEEKKKAAEAARQANLEKARAEQAAAAHALVAAQAKAQEVQARHEAEALKEAKEKASVEKMDLVRQAAKNKKNSEIPDQTGIPQKGLSAPVTNHLDQKHVEVTEKFLTAALEAHELAQIEYEYARTTLKRFNPTDTPLSGVFQVFVHSATNLMNTDKSFFKHLFGRHKQDLSDPFFQVFFWDGSEESRGPDFRPVPRTSKIINDNLDPTWDNDGRFLFECHNVWKSDFQVQFRDYDENNLDDLGSTHVLRLAQLMRDCGPRGKGTNPHLSYESETRNYTLVGKGIKHGAAQISWAWYPHHQEEYLVARDDFNEAKLAVAQTAGVLSKSGIDPEKHQLSTQKKKKIAEERELEAKNEAWTRSSDLPWMVRETKRVRENLNRKLAEEGNLGAETGGTLTLPFSNVGMWGLNFGHRSWSTVIVTGVCPGKAGAAHGVHPSWKIIRFGDHDIDDFGELVQVKKMQKEDYTLTFALPTGLPFDRHMWPGVDVGLGGLHAEDAVLSCTRTTGANELPVTIQSEKKYDGEDDQVHVFSVVFKEIKDGEIRVGFSIEGSGLNQGMGENKHSWCISSDGTFLHNGVMTRIDESFQLKSGNTVSVIIDNKQKRWLFDLWCCHKQITIVEPWKGTDLPADFENLTLIPTITMNREGQKVFVCEPHNVNDPGHRKIERVVGK